MQLSLNGTNFSQRRIKCRQWQKACVSVSVCEIQSQLIQPMPSCYFDRELDYHFIFITKGGGWSQVKSAVCCNIAAEMYTVTKNMLWKKRFFPNESFSFFAPSLIVSDNFLSQKILFNFFFSVAEWSRIHFSIKITLKVNCITLYIVFRSPLFRLGVALYVLTSSFPKYIQLSCIPSFGWREYS